MTPGQGAHTQPLSPFYLWRKGGIPYPRTGWDSAVVHAWKGKGSTDPSSIGSGRTPFTATLALCVRASRSRGELRMATVLSTPPCILQVLLASTFGSLIPAASSARGFRSSFAAKQCPNGGDPETLAPRRYGTGMGWGPRVGPVGWAQRPHCCVLQSGLLPGELGTPWDVREGREPP